MRPTQNTVRRAGRVVAGVTAIGAAVAAAAVAAAAGPAATHQDVTAQLIYQCRFSSGAAAATPVTVAARFPLSVRAGQPIRPSGARLTVRIPPALVARLTALHASTVAGTARLTTTVADQPTPAPRQTPDPSSSASGRTHTSPGRRVAPGGAMNKPASTSTQTSSPPASPSATARPTPSQPSPSQPASSQPTAGQPGPIRSGAAPVTSAWSRLTVPATHVQAGRALRLTASGPAPAVRLPLPGQATITVGALTLQLRPGHSGGAATSPATMALTCAPQPGKADVLATVTVRGGPAKRHAAAARKVTCPPQPKGGLKLNKRFPLPRPPKGIIVHHIKPSLGCAFLTGFANARKFNEAARLGMGFINVAVGIRLDYNFAKSDYFQQDSAGQLEFRPCPTCKVVHGLPPSKATFLSFGFVPTTATLQLTEVGTLNLVSIGTTQELKVNIAFSEMRLRVYNVSVNGQKLTVGPHCQTRPFEIVLTGKPNSTPPYSLQGGGPLTGNVSIPEFHGCGVTENLNPLFNGTISGPRNFSQLTQGNLCTPSSDSGCPPRKPRPIH